ncbi:MAG: hypothetical protein ACOX7H_09020 [Bacillota bacterium]
MKETLEKQVMDYSVKGFMELLSLALTGDQQAAEEIARRQDAQKAEIESLKIKASKARAPRAEKTPLELAKDNAYFRTALLVKQFGIESVNLQVLTAASAFLEQGLAQGNLRQAFNRVSQVIKAQAIEEPIFPEWILRASSEIPVLDEDKKLEEEAEKVQSIKDIVKKYMDSEQTPATAQAPEAPAQAPASAPAKKAGGKK